MKLRDAVDRYVAWQRDHGAKFRSSAETLDTFCRRIGEDRDCDAVGEDEIRRFLTGAGRIEDWRASIRVRWRFRHFRSGPQSGSLGRVSSPRSSNRTCGFPASGFRTRSCLRARKAHGRPRQEKKAVVNVQPLFREAHILPAFRPVLPTEPLAQPLGSVSIDREVGRCDLPEAEVVRPPGHLPVQALHHDPRRQPDVTCRGRFADLAADALDARLAGAGADVRPLPAGAVVSPDAVAEELKRFLRAPQASGFPFVDR